VTSASIGAGLLLNVALPSGADAADLHGRINPRDNKWDDSWTTRLGKYRTVFDVSEMDAQPGAGAVPAVMDTYNMVLGTTDADLGFVLVIRHMAVAMLLDDSIWGKYDVGSDLKHTQKDGKPFQVNPFKDLLSLVQKRGVTVLGCQSAMTGYGAMLAQRAKTEIPATRTEVQAGILPGVIMLPNGLYALARAQNVGCGVMT